MWGGVGVEVTESGHHYAGQRANSSPIGDCMEGFDMGSLTQVAPRPAHPEPTTAIFILSMSSKLHTTPTLQSKGRTECEREEKEGEREERNTAERWFVCLFIVCYCVLNFANFSRGVACF
jgi:hypothetical protein